MGTRGGEPPVRIEPRQVTFLFTDVEGSTQLLREVGAGVFGRILLDHDRLIREAVEAGRGHIVDTQGDAFFAAFETAGDGLQAALAAQRGISQHTWPGDARVRLRMGLHTGTPALSEGRYLGLDVHLGARIAAAAHGGQVLISDDTRTSLGESEGVRIRDLGEHTLKDFDVPQRLYQASAPGAEDGFPPPRTQSGEGAFSGREEELAAAAVESIVRATRRRERRRFAAIAAVLIISVAVGVAVIATRSHPIGVVPNSVAEINPKTGSVVADVPIGPTPSRIVAGLGGIWVLNEAGQTLTRINATTRAETPVGLAQAPSDLAVSGRDVWIVNGVPQTISILDAQTLTPVQQVSLHGRAGVLDDGDAAISASPNAVWVSTGAGLAEYSPTGTFRRLVGGLPHGVVASTPDAIWLGGGYGGFGSSQTLERISTSAGTPAAQLPTGAADALTVSAGAVWAVDVTAGLVRRIDPVSGAVRSVTRIPGVDAIASSGSAVWAASSDGVLVQLNPHTGQIASRIRLAGRPAGLALSRGMLWVIDQPAIPVVRGGGLRVTTVGPIDSPDPAFAYKAGSWQALYATDLNLVTYPDAAGAAGLKLVPSAAVALPKISDGGHRYTFLVRRGYRFAPTGEQVTAADFRAAIERAIKIGARSQATFLAQDIAGAKAYAANKTRHISGVQIHGQRIAITTSDVNPALPEALTLPLFSAVPPNAPLRGNGSTPIPSAGPYYVKSFVPNSALVLAKNPYYPGPRTAHLDTIAIRINPNSTWKSVASGKADYDLGDAPPPQSVMTNVDPGSSAARSGHQQAYVDPQIAPTVWFFALNTERGIFRNLDARLAVNYAIDRAALAATIGPPTATPTDQYLPSNTPGYPPGNGHVYPLSRPDLQRARTLMQHSGIHLPAHAVLNTCSHDVGCAARAQLLRKELAPIGIRITVRSFTRAEEFTRDMTDRGFDIADEGIQFVIDDPAWIFTAGYGFVRVGPYMSALKHAAQTFPPNRTHALEAFDLMLARRYAPLAAYAVPNTTDYFSRRVGCHVVYQPVFGIDLTQLCLRR